MTHPEIEAEQAHIDHAYERLEVMRERARNLASGVLGESRGGTHQFRYTRDVIVENSYRRLASLTFGDEPLVFGRIDRTVGDKFYIGRVAVADEQQEPLVVDWRAEVAEPFYRATGKVPMGLRRRRHFICRGKHLIGIDDELLDAELDQKSDFVLMGEGALLASLERPRTGRMRDIVATIQGEQDEVIRSPIEGVLVVQGGPGTGKTVVALHRAAYLLYTYRKRLERSGVLLVGPNPLFLRYIEQVLPALGEQSVKLATPSTLVPGVSATSTESLEVARVKGDARMAQVIKKAVGNLGQAPEKPLTVFYEDLDLRVPANALARIVSRNRGTDRPHNPRRIQLEKSLFRQMYRMWRNAMKAAIDRGDRPRGSGPLSPEEEKREFYEALAANQSVRETIDRMWPVLSGPQFISELFASKAKLKDAASGILSNHEIDLLVRADSSEWADADLPLIDEAAQLLGPAETAPPKTRTPEQELHEYSIDRVLQEVEEFSSLDPFMRETIRERLSEEHRREEEEEEVEGIRTYGYAIVDEAQDITPMQWRLIARRCPSGSMTITGDLGQASREWAPSGWSEVLAQLPSRAEPRVRELTVNYRTPAEIMDVAVRILEVSNPGAVPPRSVRESGVLPVVVSSPSDQLVDETRRQVEHLLESVGEGKVALIAPASELEQVRAALPHEWVHAEAGSAQLDARVACISLDEAKGLEFDAVVLVEPSDIVEEHAVGLRALYVAVTRAMKTICIVHSKPLPAPLATGLADIGIKPLVPQN